MKNYQEIRAKLKKKIAKTNPQDLADELGEFGMSFHYRSFFARFKHKFLYKFSKKQKHNCPDCGGDGVGTCHSPDHSFGYIVDREYGRIGCPVCGHDPNHKVKNEICETCNGKGKVNYKNWFDNREFLEY